jgi:long-chain acyl-CoA synthetase
LEARTAAVSSTTGSKTIADLLPRAAGRYGDRVAVHHLHEGDWRQLTFREVGEVVSEIGRGLIELGVQPGERVGLMSTTRAEWSYVDFAISTAGGVVVPVYPTNSAEECAWVLGDSGAVAAFCEDAEQLAKVLAVRDRLPALRTLVVIDPAGAGGDALPLAELRARGAERDRAELDARAEAVRPEDAYTLIYTSGTTGPPRGCVITHASARAVTTGIGQLDLVRGDEDLVYLYLPLAHAFALAIQLVAFDAGTPVAYWGGARERIIFEVATVKPTVLPSVPRLFEKFFTLLAAHHDLDRLARATEVGLRVRELQAAGEPVPDDLGAEFDELETALFANVRAACGGRLRFAVSGAAPLATEVLSFFWACGVPVLEDYGLTETVAAVSLSTPHAYRLGTVGRALPGVELRLAGDGELLVRGPNVFAGYHGDPEGTAAVLQDGWLATGDLAEIDEDGFLTITGRKKDIIITAGGKNLAPANLENDLKQSRWISQAVMYGDRRPYPVALVTLDEEQVAPWAREQGLPEDLAALSREPRIVELVQAALDRANERYAKVAQVKRFFILDHDLSQETGELTPTLKVKRSVVHAKYAEAFEALYAEGS